ncbi:MAG TPA: ABC transporter permease [Candidatus Limnocylindria bacterium]|nr:ABC transporter permease [Candidatus Limnocylindria bacterium]
MTRREAAVAPRESATGAIYDLGYRGYDGPRLGRRAAFVTLFWASLRAAFGLGRSGRSKVVPWGLSAIMIVPAAVAGAIQALAPGGLSPFNYDNYLWDLQAILALFVAAQAPELVSSDQRNRVLSLYFSHALARSDYALAKFGAMAAALFFLALAPLLVIFFASILVSTDVPAAIGDQLGNLPQIVGSPLVYAIPLAALGMAIASFTPRRAYATGAIIAVFLVSAAVGGILAEAGRGRLSLVAPLINPFVLLDGTRDWLLGASIPDSPVSRADLAEPVFGALTAVLTVIGIAAVLWRYRRIAA